MGMEKGGTDCVLAELVSVVGVEASWGLLPGVGIDNVKSEEDGEGHFYIPVSIY